MKEELQDKLVEILSAIQSTAGQAKDFTLAQLPDIAQSYVVYGRTVTIISVFGALAVLAFGLFVLNGVRKHLKKHDDFTDSNPAIVIGGGVLGAALTGSAALAVEVNLKAAVLVWFAPKVWLLKEIAGLIK